MTLDSVSEEPIDFVNMFKKYRRPLVPIQTINNY